MFGQYSNIVSDSSLMEFRSLREEAKNGGRQTSAERGSLMAAVLQLDSDAFSYTLPGNLKLCFICMLLLSSVVHLRGLHGL